MSDQALVEEIGNRALNGESLNRVLLDYKCCIRHITDGRIRNCVTEKTKLTKSFRSFEAFRYHMWKVHMVDITVRCAEMVAAKREIDEMMNDITISPKKKTMKKVSSFAPKKTTKKVIEAITYEYLWDDGTPCTKAEYDEAMAHMDCDDEEEDEEDEEA